MGYKAYWTIPKLKPELDENDILSFHWGVSSQQRSWEKNPSGTSQVHDFSVVKRVDAGSPKLFTACAVGTNLPEIKVFLASYDGKTIKVYATYTFKDCYINSVRPGGGGGSDAPLEEVGVNFKEASYKYEKDY